MIKIVTAYSVVCDRCGKIIVANGGLHLTISYALASKWKEIGDNHYCPDCYKFDDVLNVYVPKKKGDK